jgi:hypothetical protein
LGNLSRLPQNCGVGTLSLAGSGSKVTKLYCEMSIPS